MGAERIESVTILFSKLAGLMAETGADRLRQVEVAEELADLNKTLESKVTERTHELAETNAVLQSREALFKQILDASSVADLLDRQGRIVEPTCACPRCSRGRSPAWPARIAGSLVHPAERARSQHQMLQRL